MRWRSRLRSCAGRSCSLAAPNFKRPPVSAVNGEVHERYCTSQRLHASAALGIAYDRHSKYSVHWRYGNVVLESGENACQPISLSLGAKLSMYPQSVDAGSDDDATMSYRRSGAVNPGCVSLDSLLRRQHQGLTSFFLKYHSSRLNGPNHDSHNVHFQLGTS
jgi:hypothetical protein